PPAAPGTARPPAATPNTARLPAAPGTARPPAAAPNTARPPAAPGTARPPAAPGTARPPGAAPSTAMQPGSAPTGPAGAAVGATMPPGPPPKPAGSSAVESSDVPAWKPAPPRFAVAPFENRSNLKVLDWLIAGAPFEISEKTEAVLGLEPTGGPLHVGGAAVESEPGPVAELAAARGAVFVITGWVERPNWQLRIGIALWTVKAGAAVVAAETQRTGEPRTYHQLLGEALAEVWSKGGGLSIDAAHAQRLQRVLSNDLYAVNLMGRGLGHLTGAIAGQAAASAAANAPAGAATGSAAGSAGPGAPGEKDLKLAEHDLGRAVLIDPKCFEAQRLLGELYLSIAAGDPKLTARALGKFNYANDLAPDDIASLRAAATGAVQTGKHEVALELWRKLTTRRPWDLDARYELGAALWRTADPGGAEKQLEQVTAHRPDHLAARRVLVLIHAARSDTPKLVRELEAIAARAPADLEVKADLATAYGALAQWDKAVTALEAIALVRTGDVALQIRIGDANRKQGNLDGALAANGRASRLMPESSWPGFAAAQALFDAGKLGEANRAYTMLQRYRDDLPAAEQALGAIALLQNRPDDAAWYLRRAAVAAPRNAASWRALIAAELARKDAATALRDAGAALPTWPGDAQLRYLAGIAHAMLDERAEARRELAAAAAERETQSPSASAARAASAAAAAIDALDAGATIALSFTPELVRPWGDADAIARALERHAAIEQAMAQSRATYQRQVLGLLGALHRGPLAPAKADPVRRCPIARVATGWAAAQRELAASARLGVELEATWRFIARHDEVGATAALMPNTRTQVATARR